MLQNKHATDRKRLSVYSSEFHTTNNTVVITSKVKKE